MKKIFYLIFISIFFFSQIAHAEIKNYQVSEDEIIAITNGILKIFDVKENLIPQDGGKNILIQVTIKSSIDSYEIKKILR